MKNILVGVDGSEEAVAAATKACELAEAMKAAVSLVYVVPHNPPPGPASYAPESVPFELVERDYAAALLHDLETRMRRPGVSVDTATASGNPAESLADLAKTHKADLVVVGHRGRGAVSRVLLGSVADRLIQISPCPVLVVR